MMFLSMSELCSHHLQPAERSLTGRELIGFNAEALEHRDEEVGQWVVVLLVEGEVLSVLEAAAREQGGEVHVAV